MNLSRSLLAFFLITLFAISSSCKKRDKITVACVGDSITFGAGLEDSATDSYPAQLQQLLGDGYEVINLGIGSCTLLRKGRPRVWDELPKIKDAAPDMVVISLGTNDTCGMGTCGERKCWEYKDEYIGDYQDLIDTLRTLPSNPKLWIAAPTPMVLETPGLSPLRLEGLTIRKPRLQELIGIIKQVVREKDVAFIDLNTPLDHHPELFAEKDGVHPNPAGYRAIAELVYRELKQSD